MTIYVFRSNLVEGIDQSYVSKCLHNPETDPLCPIFKLGDIVKLSGFNFETIAREVSQLQHRHPDLNHLLCVFSMLDLYSVHALCPDREGLLASWSTGHVTSTWILNTVNQSTSSTACTETLMRRTKSKLQWATTSGVWHSSAWGTKHTDVVSFLKPDSKIDTISFLNFPCMQAA